jgi:hypothetical protein
MSIIVQWPTRSAKLKTISEYVNTGETIDSKRSSFLKDELSSLTKYPFTQSIAK